MQKLLQDIPTFEYDQKVYQDDELLFEYLSLEKTLEILKPVLEKHNRWIYWTSKGRTVFLHLVNETNGVERIFELAIPDELQMATIHLFGGAITYTQRRLLHLTFGIIGEAQGAPKEFKGSLSQATLKVFSRTLKKAEEGDVDFVKSAMDQFKFTPLQVGKLKTALLDSGK